MTAANKKARRLLHHAMLNTLAQQASQRSPHEGKPDDEPEQRGHTDDVHERWSGTIDDRLIGFRRLIYQMGTQPNQRLIHRRSHVR